MPPAPPKPPAYVATALTGPDGTVADVRLEADGKVRHLAGRGGGQAEAASAGEDERVCPGAEVERGEERVELPGAGGRAAQIGGGHRPLGAEDHGDTGGPVEIGPMAETEPRQEQVGAGSGQWRWRRHGRMLASREPDVHWAAGFPRPPAS